MFPRGPQCKAETDGRKQGCCPLRYLFRNQENSSKVLGGLDWAGVTLDVDHPTKIDCLGFAELAPSREEKLYFLSHFKEAYSKTHA